MKRKENEPIKLSLSNDLIDGTFAIDECLTDEMTYEQWTKIRLNLPESKKLPASDSPKQFRTLIYSNDKDEYTLCTIELISGKYYVYSIRNNKTGEYMDFAEFSKNIA